MIKTINAIYSDEKTLGDGRDIPIRQVIRVLDYEGNEIADKDAYSFAIEQIGNVFNNDDSIAITWAEVREKLLKL